MIGREKNKERSLFDTGCAQRTRNALETKGCKERGEAGMGISADM